MKAQLLRGASLILPPLVWAGIIVGLSAQSQPADIELPSGADKVIHAGVYFVLGALTARALRGYDFPAVKAARLALILCAVFGISDEFHQSTVPGRVPDMMDWAADLIGALIGAWTWVIFQARRQQRREGSAP